MRSEPPTPLPLRKGISHFPHKLNPGRESFTEVCGLDDWVSSVHISMGRWVPTRALEGNIFAHTGHLEYLKMERGDVGMGFFSFLYSRGMGRDGR